MTQLLILPGEHDSVDELKRHADKLAAFLGQVGQGKLSGHGVGK